MAISRLSIIKFLEFALSVVCVALHYHSFVGDATHLMVLTATFGGYLIITAGALGGHLSANPVNRGIDIFFCVLGCALFIASGSMGISWFQNSHSGKMRDYGLTKSALALVNGVVFLLDAVFVYRG